MALHFCRQILSFVHNYVYLWTKSFSYPKISYLILFFVVVISSEARYRFVGGVIYLKFGGEFFNS